MHQLRSINPKLLRSGSARVDTELVLTTFYLGMLKRIGSASKNMRSTRLDRIMKIDYYFAVFARILTAVDIYALLHNFSS